MYCYNFSQDNKYIKLLGTSILYLYSCVLLVDVCSVVYGIFLLETEQTALTVVDLYHVFAVNFDLFLVSWDVPYYLRVFDLNIPRTVISLSVQLFFVYRILALKGKQLWWLCVIICLVSLFPKPENRIIILLVAIHCQRTSSVRIGCLGKYPLLYMT